MLTCLMLSLVVAQAHPAPTLTLVLKDANRGLYEATVKNPNQASWYFLGYSREYAGSSLPPNQICPIVTTQYKTAGQWTAQFDGRCGVGINPVELKPGTSTFVVYLHFNNGKEAHASEARIGISILTSKEWRHCQQLWSNPIRAPKP